MDLCCYFSTARCVPDHNWNCMSSRDFAGRELWKPLRPWRTPRRMVSAWMDTLAIFGRCPEPGVCAVKP